MADIELKSNTGRLFQSHPELEGLFRVFTSTNTGELFLVPEKKSLLGRVLGGASNARKAAATLLSSIEQHEIPYSIGHKIIPSKAELSKSPNYVADAYIFSADNAARAADALSLSDDVIQQINKRDIERIAGGEVVASMQASTPRRIKKEAIIKPAADTRLAEPQREPEQTWVELASASKAPKPGSDLAIALETVIPYTGRR